MRDPIYFTLVKLSDGALASLTIIRQPHEFFAQLTSYGFVESVGASSPALENMATSAFLKTVSGVFGVSRDRSYTYEIPEGTTWADWLTDLEKRAHDPRFIVVERDGALAYSMIVPTRR